MKNDRIIVRKALFEKLNSYYPFAIKTLIIPIKYNNRHGSEFESDENHIIEPCPIIDLFLNNRNHQGNLMTDTIGQEQALQKQVQELQNKLDQLRADNQTIWKLLVQIANRLQRSSTSIKTAVSSLLDYDIFWDATTQYEFLQAIDSSTDELSDLIVLMTLAFRSQAKTLEIETEPNMIQEILATLQNTIAKNNRPIQLIINHPAEGKPVLVDYQYLSVALGLLVEVITGEDKGVTRLSMQATEFAESWHLQINDLNTSLVTIIHHFLAQSNDITTIVNQILPENALKLMTACRILHLQNIKLNRQDTADPLPSLCFIIPIVTTSTFIE
jgi:hypothetical protein